MLKTFRSRWTLATALGYLLGSIVGAVASWISGKALQDILQISDSDPDPEYDKK